MSRTIITARDVAAARAAAGLQPASPAASIPAIDEYKDRLIKYIPAEVITLYMALVGIVGSRSAGHSRNIAEWVIFGAGVLATPIQLRFHQKVTKTQQIVISTLAFIIWAITFGGPFTQVFSEPDLKMWGAIALVLFTFAVAGYEP